MNKMTILIVSVTYDFILDKSLIFSDMIWIDI